MSSLTWIRGFNGTIGRIAPRWTAERMRRTFMVPGEWPPKDWELPLLASSERVTLRFGLSVLRWGEGPAVLLLHGWAGRPTQFAHLIEQLVGAGYSVYALDAPAHGRSPGREANVVLFAHALLEAAGELPPLRAVVGHSLGGAAALLAAQMGLRSEALVTVRRRRGFSNSCACSLVSSVCRPWLARISSAWSSVRLAYPRRAWMWRATVWKCPGWWCMPTTTRA
ncbi:alpha/beta hydrolase [Pseudomonas aeruginosa]